MTVVQKCGIVEMMVKNMDKKKENKLITMIAWFIVAIFLFVVIATPILAFKNYGSYCGLGIAIMSVVCFYNVWRWGKSSSTESK